MSRIEGVIIINQPIETVCDFVADERNEPRYNPDMIKAEKVSDGPIGPGTRFRAETLSRGRTTEMIIEFTTYNRPKVLVSSTSLSSMDIRGSLTFDVIDKSTRMRWSWDLKPRGLLKLITPLIRIMGKRQ